jgi:hypothetical protein
MKSKPKTLRGQRTLRKKLATDYEAVQSRRARKKEVYRQRLMVSFQTAYVAAMVNLVLKRCDGLDLMLRPILGRLLGHPGPALLLQYLHYWCLPKQDKEQPLAYRNLSFSQLEEEGDAPLCRLPRAGKAHKDLGHWIYNTYEDIGRQLGYKARTIRDWAKVLVDRKLISYKRKWADGKQRTHWTVNYGQLLIQLVKLPGEELLHEALFELDREGMAGATTSSEGIWEILVERADQARHAVPPGKGSKSDRRKTSVTRK